MSCCSRVSRSVPHRALVRGVWRISKTSMRGRVALARVELAQSPGAALLAQRRDPPAAAAPMQHGEEESGLRLLDLRCRCWLYAPGAIDQSDAAGHIAHMDHVSRRAAACVPPREGARVKGLDRLPALGVHS